MAYYVGKILKSSEEVWAMYEVLYVFFIINFVQRPNVSRNFKSLYKKEIPSQHRCRVFDFFLCSLFTS